MGDVRAIHVMRLLDRDARATVRTLLVNVAVKTFTIPTSTYREIRSVHDTLRDIVLLRPGMLSDFNQCTFASRIAYIRACRARFVGTDGKKTRALIKEDVLCSRELQNTGHVPPPTPVADIPHGCSANAWRVLAFALLNHFAYYMYNNSSKSIPKTFRFLIAFYGNRSSPYFA